MFLKTQDYGKQKKTLPNYLMTVKMGPHQRGEMVWPPDDNEIWSTTLPDGTLAWYFQTGVLQ